MVLDATAPAVDAATAGRDGELLTEDRRCTKADLAKNLPAETVQAGGV